jgi:hypothetical protein
MSKRDADVSSFPHRDLGQKRRGVHRLTKSMNQTNFKEDVVHGISPTFSENVTQMSTAQDT